MDRHNFISKIISMYPHYIKDSGIDTYYELYKRSLGGKKVDYEKLFDVFSNEYREKSPPTGAYISEIASKCLKEEVQTAQKYIHVKVFNPIYNAVTNTDCFPSGTSEQAMLNAYKKMFPNTEGWRIVEVY